MVGKVVSLLYRQDMKKGGVTLLTIHASFTSAMQHMREEADYYESKGYVVERNNDRSFIVMAVDKPLWYYFISSRTIDK